MPEFVYQRPFLYDKQAAIVDDPHRYVIVEATTKSGKTVLCLVWISELCMFGGGMGRNYWWVATTSPVAKIAFTRMKIWLRRSSLPLDRFCIREQEQSVEWPNGSKLWFKTGEKPDNLYGEDVYGAVIDEATRLREAAWHAIRSTLTATKGPVRIIGNVKGRRNWAYKLARKAERGSPDMSYYKITCWDAVKAGILDLAEVEDARLVLPAKVFAELYEAVASDDGGNPFDLVALQDCAINGLAEGPAVCFGLDLGKSQDYTVVTGMNKNRQICKLARFQGQWTQQERRIADIIGNCPTAGDSTGVGDPIIERLQDSGLDIEGVVFTARSKQQLMEGWAATIQRRETALPGADGDEINRWLMLEHESFEYVYTRTGVRYSAPEGEHDDGVCSAALCDYKFHNMIPYAMMTSGERAVASEFKNRVREYGRGVGASLNGFGV